jgi:hypothetical protein
MTDLGKSLGARLIIEAMKHPTPRERAVKYILGYVMITLATFLLLAWWAGS